MYVFIVLGPINPDLLGHTLTHEHMENDFEYFYTAPQIEIEEYLNQKISLNTVGFVRQYPYSSLENIKFYDETNQMAVKNDIQLFKRFGGGSIVENSSYGLKRNLAFMADIQKTTGVNIIAGTGHYVHGVQTPDHLAMTIEQMTDLYAREIITGIDVPGFEHIKCGFIGEVGSVYPLHDFEKRAIRATGEIQDALGCGVSFHPGRNPKAPFEIIRLYLEAGGKREKCSMSHLERTIFDLDMLFDFAELGTYIQYDLFGVECSFYQFNSLIDMPSDAQRINNLMSLIEDGKIDKIHMSQDIHTKHRLVTKKLFDYILNDIIFY